MHNNDDFFIPSEFFYLILHCEINKSKYLNELGMIIFNKEEVFGVFVGYNCLDEGPLFAVGYNFFHENFISINDIYQ